MAARSKTLFVHTTHQKAADAPIELIAGDGLGVDRPVDGLLSQSILCKVSKV